MSFLTFLGMDPPVTLARKPLFNNGDVEERSTPLQTIDKIVTSSTAAVEGRELFAFIKLFSTFSSSP
jgi:hypothetical protein